MEGSTKLKVDISNGVKKQIKERKKKIRLIVPATLPTQKKPISLVEIAEKGNINLKDSADREAFQPIIDQIDDQPKMYETIQDPLYESS